MKHLMTKTYQNPIKLHSMNNSPLIQWKKLADPIDYQTKSHLSSSLYNPENIYKYNKSNSQERRTPL